ncbi:MAG TPA: hypothetical protein VFQ92_10145 [Blastocatellia bacterium]|nr:hypothetical protein [Blastocatellia bacterium]
MNRVFKSIPLIVMMASLLASVPAQGQQQKDASPAAKGQTAAAPAGSNTPGRIAKFTTTKAVGDSNITEDAAGNIGIGTTLPTSRLTVNGVIEMLGAGAGIKFADGTLQTTAGIAVVSRDATLQGDGTQASPLGLSVPLILSGESPASGIIKVTNNRTSGIGIEARGGMLGAGVVGTGGIGSQQNARAGSGVVGVGGDSVNGNGVVAGSGVLALGGRGDVVNGEGVVAMGGGAAFGSGTERSGAAGVRAIGGEGQGVGRRGGPGIVAERGFGLNGATVGFAGVFIGDVQVQGTLSKFAGSFKIDHPLDPENKYLSHSFVESPDMMNIYNGNITTDQNGLATIELPDYFEALNRDFRYQLTVVGQFAQAIVAEKVKNNRFTIQTSAPGVEVSWQVTGIRQDAWANKNRIPVEEAKSEKERGHYLYPEGFGKDEEHSVTWANEPEMMREMKKQRQQAEQKRPVQR